MIFNVTGSGAGMSGATLEVSAPAGCTVTITKDGKTKTKTADPSGVAAFKGLATGQWIVTITDGSQTVAKTVTITADYAITITFFEATINVTYPAGSKCTATDGATTLIAPDTSGTWACVVPNAGTWTIAVAGKGWTDSVEITKDGDTARVDVTAHWYYRDGDTRNAITGGWAASKYATLNAGTVSFASGSINLAANMSGAAAVTSEKVTIVEDTLYVAGSLSSGAGLLYVGLCNETYNINPIASGSIEMQSGAENVARCDVRGFKGQTVNVYILLFANSGAGAASVHRVYGE